MKKISDEDRKFNHVILMGLMIWITLMAMLITYSCSAPRVSAILPDTAKVIERDGDRLLIMFKNVGDKPHSFSWEWFFCPELRAVALEDMEVAFTIKEKKKP